MCEAVVCQQPLTDALEESYEAMKCHLRATNMHAQIAVSGTAETIQVLKHMSLKMVIKYKLNKTTIHAQK